MTDISIYSYPWNHGIANDVINSELILELNEISKNLPLNTHIYDILDLTNIGIISNTLAHKIILFADSILDDYIDLISKFDEVSPYGYICKPQIHVLNNYSSNLQTDQYKSFIFNICILNEYDIHVYNDDQLAKIEKINLNQGFLFCPKDQITWNKRIHKSHTVNLYIYFSKLDNWFDDKYRTENLPLLDSNVLQWQMKLFKQGLLIRSPFNIAQLF